MARYKSKFTNKKHSIGGIMATAMGVCSVGLFVASIVESTKARGEGGTIVGSLALLALAFSAFGLLTGLLSYREIDRYTTFSKIGSILCGIMSILLVMMVFAGL